MLAATASARAQTAERIGTGGIVVSAGLQRYDLGSLNDALTSQGFPVLEEGATQVRLSFSRRYPGRVKAALGFYTENFPSPADRRGDNGERVFSTRAIAAGMSYDVDIDLLYPSAWNVYVGAGVDAGGLRLVTSRVDGGGFSGDLRENKFTVGTFGVGPRLTAESVEFNTKGGGLRVIGSVGYRFGVSQELDRENFTNQRPGVEVEPTGLNWQLGFVATIR